MRSKVIFIHVMKCGGTTLRHLLADEYPREQIAPVPIDPKSDAVPPYPFLRQDEQVYERTVTAAEMARYRLVMSHYTWRVVDRLGDGWQVMTMLRHPVRQLLSRYYFIRRARDLHGDEWERTCGEFPAWVREHSGRYANRQTWALGGGDVARAIARLGDERLTFGLVERFGESVERFNQVFGWSLPSTPPRYNRAAVNTDRVELGAETVALVEDVQWQDMRLYRAAVARFC